MRNLKLGRFAGKVAIVTGASSGIGEGTANLLAAEGARVIVADLDVEGGQRTVDRIATGGGEAVFVEADVSEAAQVQQMVAQTVEVFGRLDILHNNAIWYENAPATELEETVWDRTLNTGLKAIFLAAKYAIPAMLKTGGGSIVNTGSVHSLVGFETHTAYDAAKAGVLGITTVLALDYGPAIRVNAVLPGAILTPLWDRMKVTADDRRRLAKWCRPNGWARLPTSRTPSFSWPPTRRRLLPERRSSWMGECWRERCKTARQIADNVSRFGAQDPELAQDKAGQLQSGSCARARVHRITLARS